MKEKIPFFIASALFCVITFRIQKADNAITSLRLIGLGARLENVISSYITYLGKLFWPTNLTILCPFPNHFDAAQVALSALLLIAISILCILQLSRRPYLALGWFWYLGTLVPVIGLVQLYEQGMADRYTYLPLIGPVFSLVWLISERVKTESLHKWVAVLVTALILAICAVLTNQQLKFWRDTVSLFERTSTVTPENAFVQYTIALGFSHKGDLRRAAVHYREAITDGNLYNANYYFAELLAKGGYYSEAQARLEAALKTNPNATDALNNLSWLLSTCPNKRIRNGERAVQLATEACELTHDGSAQYLTTLSAAYAQAGRFDDAIATIQKAGAIAQETGQMGMFNGDAQLLELFTDHQTYTDPLK